MKNNILPAIRLTIVCLILFSGLYTLIVLGIAQLTPGNGGGELITANGKSYYLNIGQSFTEDKYFCSRPSSASYNAAGSSGSNKGPSNPEYLAGVKSRIDTFILHNPTIKPHEIPSELVTFSGSGLDPNISVEAAKIQIARIAQIREMSKHDLDQLIDQHIERPLFGLFGPQKINLLKLNIALDNLNNNK